MCTTVDEEQMTQKFTFFNSTINTCFYHRDDLFYRTIKVDGKISIVHLNHRSLHANVRNIKEYLSKLKHIHSNSVTFFV